MTDDRPYSGQIIIEKSFRTKADAERWIERMRERREAADPYVRIETHLWEPPS